MENRKQQSAPRAWVEIDTQALRENVQTARVQSGGLSVMPVVKAGAYGHGLEVIAQFLASEPGVAFFGVANVGEARRIRRAGVDKPIYLLGATWSGEREEIVRENLTPCLSSIEEAREFAALATQQGKTLAVHLSVDTGMGRGGFVLKDLQMAWPELSSLSSLRIEGLSSHLSSADEDREFTEQQIARFREAGAVLGANFRWKHLSSSAGLLAYAQGDCNLVRPGLMMYGTSPIPEYQKFLKNVMSFKTRVTLVRELPAGHGISYGKTFVTTKPTRVATIGAGYGDGYPRHASGHGAHVWLRGRRLPILGRVTMDQMMVDVTDAPDVCEGDEVELFGANLSVNEIAQWADTISWEIYTGITPRVTRLYGTEGKFHEA